MPPDQSAHFEEIASSVTCFPFSNRGSYGLAMMNAYAKVLSYHLYFAQKGLAMQDYTRNQPFKFV